MEWLYCWLRESGYSQEINWRAEAEVAEDLGYTCHSIDYESLLEGDLDRALESLPDGEGTNLVYRGWIMPDEDYAELESGLEDRGYSLLTSSYQYALVTGLPNYHELVEHLTPPAVWTWDPDIEEAWELAQTLGPGPYIIKDHVKSAKEAWLEACYVPAGASYEQFRDIGEELRYRRGNSFTRGFVVRPYVPLVQLGAHWIGMPIFEEYRLIFWKGKLILADRYHEELGGNETDFSKFEGLPEIIDSPFFVADVARKEEDGELILIELNDGGAAGLPPECHPMDFYGAVFEAEEGMAG